MKKLFIILAASIGFAACGDNSGVNDGDATDPSISAPPTSEPDNTTTETDTTTINSGGSQIDTTSLNGAEGEGAGESNSPGKTGNDDNITR